QLGKPLYRVKPPCVAIARHRTSSTIWSACCADGSPEFHDRLVEGRTVAECATIVGRGFPGPAHQIPGQRPKLMVYFLICWIASDSEEARQHSNRIAVEHRRRRVKRDAANRTGRIPPDSRQSYHLLKSTREHSVILLHDNAGPVLQIARAMVVAQSFPKLQNAIRAAF